MAANRCLFFEQMLHSDTDILTNYCPNDCPKRLDAQVLLSPFEKQLDLQALAARACNQFGLETRVVGQKYEALASIGFDCSPAQRRGLALAGTENLEHADLLSQHVDPASPLGIWNVG